MLELLKFTGICKQEQKIPDFSRINKNFLCVFCYYYLLLFSLSENGGGTEIRTQGDLRHDSFQDCCIKPLCHPSV